MQNAIDLNKGVMIKKHPSGMLVYMYIKEPGVYLNAFGKEIDEKVAAAADYDVKLLGKQKLRRERMATAMTEIEIELELAVTADTEIVLWEREGYRVVELPLGNAHVYDDDGNRMTAIPIPQPEAKRLLDHLVPEKEKE